MFIAKSITRNAVLALLLAGSGAYAQAETSSAVQKVKNTYYEILDKDTSTLSFDKNQSGISESQRSDLKALVNKAMQDSNVEKFIVAAWSDKEYPAAKSVELGKGDKKLAEARKDNAAKVLKELGANDVDAYSMAKNPSWISKVFQTDESRLKGEVKEKNKDKDSDDLLVEKTGEQLRKLGGPGKIVVIVKRTI